MVELARALAGGSLEHTVIGVFGASFKPDSDESGFTSARRVGELRNFGARVTVYDPVALGYAGGFILSWNSRLRNGGCGRRRRHALLTEWREFAEADPEILGKVVAQRKVADGGTRWTKRLGVARLGISRTRPSGPGSVSLPG